MNLTALAKTLHKPATAGHRLLNLFLFLAVALILGWLLATLKFVFLPMLLAAFITFLLNPLVECLHRWRVPRLVGVATTLILTILIAWLAINYVASSFSAFHNGFPKYEERLQEIISQAKAIRDSNLTFLTADHVRTALSKISLSGLVGGTFNSFFSALSYMVVTLLFVLYFLPAYPLMSAKIKRAWPGPKGHALCRAVEGIGRQVQNYIWAKTLTSLLTGLGLTLACLFFGVDFAVTWGVFAAALNFIPTIGAILSCLPPILVCALQYSWPEAMWLSAALGVLMVATGNLLEPKILGRSVNLSPTIALISLFFWGWLWGGVGMLVAVPVTAMLKFTCDNIESLKPIGVILGN